MSSEPDSRRNQFVVDGCENAWRALQPLIRAEVEREFAAELQQASFWRRFWVRRKIAREIERRLAAAAPPGALY